MITLPGIATAHSHAFQRAIRGRTHLSPSPGVSDSFWSWRNAMYQFAEHLCPETIYAISRYAFAELAASGVTAVGEFHYLHHDKDGSPYASRTELSERVIEAAKDVGIRICLLRVLYQRGGAGKPPEGAQRRFSDANLDDALSDIQRLLAKYAGDPLVRIGIAPHSVRAVESDWIRQAATFAENHQLPFHAHVSEQPRELEECQAEHGCLPIELFHREGALNERFVGVHATHASENEVRLLAQSGGYACICRTTERDLGDGSPPLSEMVQAGVKLCPGVDSHAITDPFVEARAIELDERVRKGSRNAALGPNELLELSTKHAYAAIGFAGLETEDSVTLRDHPALLGTDATACFFSATGAAVEEATVGGTAVALRGSSPVSGEIREAFVEACEQIRGSA